MRLPLGVRNVLVVGYLAVQVALPLRGLSRDRIDDPGRFSWNMYADRRTCVQRYVLVSPEATVELDPRALLQRSSHHRRVNTRRALPKFHEFLCDYLRDQGFRGRLEVEVRCSLNGGPFVDLVDPSVDVCSATEYGVFGE